MKIVFVDGYNVLNSWFDLSKKETDIFDTSRNKLVHILHNYATYTDSKVIIVYDGYKVNGNLESCEKISKNLEIVFTKTGETADSYIEKQVHFIGRKYEVCVVTSDSLEQQTIFQRGAVRISSIEFYSDVLKVEKGIRKKTEKNNSIQKNHLQDNIDKEILEELEKMRRGK